LPALDVFVNTSVFEGVSLTILEAMAAALPVVATQVGGTPEVVVDGETGVLVPSDPEAIAGALSALLYDSERRRMFGRAGRTRVERLFSIDRMIQQYASVYEAFGVGACVA
jgi:glycosyltransferase involved in cell wall biosynthesis